MDELTVYFLSKKGLEKVLKEKNKIDKTKESGYKNYGLDDLTEKEIKTYFQATSLEVFTYLFNCNSNMIKDGVIKIF